MEKAKKFRLFDCVLAVVCVVLTLEAASPAASIGNSQFFWWLLLLVCFCLPYGLISAELGTAYESDGGLCDWVNRAFGAKWGSRTAWYYWVNFPLWMASVSVLVTDNIGVLLGGKMSLPLLILCRLAFISALVLLSLFDLSQNKWLFNISTLFKIIIMGTLGVAGVYGALKNGSANPITAKSLLPSPDLRSLSFISIIIFNFMGFEVVTTYVDEMPNPKRDIPKAVIWGGLIVMTLYILASFGIGAAIPIQEISPSMGVLDSLKLLLPALAGGQALIIIIGLMIIVVMFANQLSWSFGINHTARYCANQGGGMPKIFRLSTKKGAPLGAALMNGLVAGILAVIGDFLPSEQLFWSFFALNLVTLLLSYVPLFPAFLKLRKIDPDRERPYKVIGGKKFLTVITFVPLVFLVAALFFTVVPLSADEVADKLPLVAGSILALVSGEIIAARAKK